MTILEQAKAIQREVGCVTIDGDLGPESTQKIYSRLFGATPTPASLSLAETIASLAEGEIGVHEIGGNNRGVEKYQRATWLSVGAWPWCAAFVCWVVQQAIAGKTVAFDRPQTAGAWDFENWARSQALKGVQLIKPALSSLDIRRGDIVVFTFSHIGIATDTVSGHVKSVDGNTNDEGARDGDGVYEKTRAFSLVRSLIRLT